MANIRFHHKHFPTFLRLPELISRPMHWTTHLGMLTFVICLIIFGAVQTVQLANLRRAVAEREAAVWLTAPFGTVAEPSLLGETIVCEPALLRWYFGTRPLCEAGLGSDKAEKDDL